jgi:hypothetical protein
VEGGKGQQVVAYRSALEELVASYAIKATRLRPKVGGVQRRLSLQVCRRAPVRPSRLTKLTKAD